MAAAVVDGTTRGGARRSLVGTTSSEGTRVDSCAAVLFVTTRERADEADSRHECDTPHDPRRAEGNEFVYSKGLLAPALTRCHWSGSGRTASARRGVAVFESEDLQLLHAQQR
jgi:hypothetical protein